MPAFLGTCCSLLPSVVPQLLTLLLLFQGAFAQCPDVPLSIYEEANLANSLGTFRPISTAQSVEEFYGYKAGSFQGGILPLEGKTSLITIHQNSNTCDLGLVVVHSKPFEGDWFMVASMWFNGDTWNALVKDDPQYTNWLLHDDSYDDLFSRLPGYTHVKSHWFWQDTDGMAHAIVSNWTGCIRAKPEFDTPNGNGFATSIENWKFVGAGGNETTTVTTTTVDLNLRRELFICLPGGDPRNPGIHPFPRTDTEGNCANIGTYYQPPCGMCERHICHVHFLCAAMQKSNCHFGTEFFIPPPAGWPFT